MDIKEAIRESEEYYSGNDGLSIYDGDVERQTLNVVTRQDREHGILDDIAYEQTLLPLEKPISNEHISLIVNMVTAEMTGRMKRMERMANKEAKRLLTPFVPFQLRLMYQLYRQSFKKRPSFLYHCSDSRYNFQMWLSPDLPIYTAEGEDERMLLEYPEAKRALLESYIVDYRKTEKRRTQVEFIIANSLHQTNMNKLTYGYLYEKRPMWFKTVYDKTLQDVKDLL